MQGYPRAQSWVRSYSPSIMDDLTSEVSNSQVNLFVDGYQQFFKFEVSDSANAIWHVNNALISI